MSDNLLSLVQSALGDDFAKLTGQFLGESVPSTRSALTSLLPAVLGGAAYQINVLVGTLLASFLPEGSVSYLYYAERLLEFPLAPRPLVLRVRVARGQALPLPCCSRRRRVGTGPARC